ncbi:MAG: hypothetical protein KJZ47_01630 [Gemmatimonadales bacterium]|nr:hypothetical protein [Gemmatimonadales bacterium]
MDPASAIALLGTGLSLYFAWRSVREQHEWQSMRDLVVPRAAKWLLGLGVITTSIGLAAAHQVDRSNAGIHPEWIGTARAILSIELYVSITLFVVAGVLIVRASKRAQVEEWPQSQPPVARPELEGPASSEIVRPGSVADPGIREGR